MYTVNVLNRFTLLRSYVTFTAVDILLTEFLYSKSHYESIKIDLVLLACEFKLHLIEQEGGYQDSVAKWMT